MVRERAHVAKHGYKDRNLRQQNVLRGELSPYNGNGKAPKQQNMAKPPVNRKLFAEKEVSPKTKHGKSSDKPVAETTKAWVVKSFAEKPANADKETEQRSDKHGKVGEPNKSNFKPASWYRDYSVEATKAASDPGKFTSRKALSNDNHGSKLAAQGKETSSVCSQVMVNATDVEEVISPLK